MSEKETALKILVIYLTEVEVHATPSGGVEHFMQVFKRIAKMGHKVHVMTTRAGAMRMRIRGFHATTYIIKVPLLSLLSRSISGLSILYMLRAFIALLYLIRLPTRFDLVCSVTHFVVPDIVPSYVASKFNKVVRKPIVYLHGPLFPPPTKRRYHPYLRSFLGWILQEVGLSFIKRFNPHIFAVPFTKGQLDQRADFCGKDILCVNNGVDLEFILAVPPVEKGYDACFLGGIVPKKGIFDLVDIWHLLCKEMPNAKLAVIGGGGGDMEQALEDEVTRRGLGKNIFVLGYLPEREKIATLKGSRIFLYPSREESWGIVICEAMACGLPVVAYDLPEYKFWGNAMIRVPKGDVRAFASMGLELLRNTEFIDKMRKRGIEKASQFSWDRAAEFECSALKNVLRKGQLQI